MKKTDKKSSAKGTDRRKDTYYAQIAPKAISRTRQDISNWTSALKTADNIDRPRRARLINLYSDILLDAHLSSQIELRRQRLLALPFAISKDGKILDAETSLLRNSAYTRSITSGILDSVFYGHTLLELNPLENDNIDVITLPRQNVVPQKGIILLSEDSDNGIEYRNNPDYGIYILEFGSDSDYGLLNKAIPHALFKRFAQACWSELCEIYAIPPRYIKTNTQDAQMLDRAEKMLRDMGSAAWFIIDESESFDFAKGADTNGDVYSNLISLCKEEISLLINGAVIGQDTKNGNRSKEESSLKLLEVITQSDKALVTGYWNETIIPALIKLGILPDGAEFSYVKEEDVEKLWSMAKEAMQYYDFDPKWIEQTFGLKVLQTKETKQKQLSSFFD